MKKLILLLMTIFLLQGTNVFGAVNKLNWDSAQQTIWSNLYNAGAGSEHYNRAKAIADKCTNCGSGDDTILSQDTGLVDAIIYQASGNSSYADSSWQDWQDVFMQGGTSDLTGYCGQNCVRANCLNNVVQYSLAADGISAGAKTAWQNELDNWMLATTGQFSQNSTLGATKGDSDEDLAAYACVMAYAAAIKDDGTSCTAQTEFGNTTNCATKATALLDSAVYATYLVDQWSGGLGGLNATGTGADTLRNQVNNFCQIGDGDWIESTEYNAGTATTVLQMIDIANEHYGSTCTVTNDCFPECDHDTMAEVLADIMTPGASDMVRLFQYGDVQSDAYNDPRWFRRLGYVGAAAHLSGNANTLWVANEGYSQYPSGSPMAHSYWLFANPDGTDTAPTGQTSANAPGMGIATWHNAWTDSNDTAWFSQQKPSTFLDHGWDGMGQINVWRNGNWAIWHPIGYYGNTDIEGQHLNTSIANSAMPVWSQEARGQIHYEAGLEYLYHVGTSGGHVSKPGNYLPPGESLKEFTHSKLFIHNDDDSTTIVVFDRFDALRPDQVASYDRWDGMGLDVEQNRMEAANYQHQFLMRMPNQAVKSGNEWSWTAENGDTVYVETFIDNYTSNNTNNGVDYGGNWRTPDPRKYELRIYTADTYTQWQTMLHTIHVGSNPTMTELTPVSDSAALGTAEGVYIEAGTQNSAAIFNGEQGIPPNFTGSPGGYASHNSNYLSDLKPTHYFNDAFSISIPADGNVDVYIADLNPTGTWTISGGSASGSISPSAEGLYRYTDTTGSTFTLQLDCAGCTVPTCANLCSACTTNEAQCIASSGNCTASTCGGTNQCIWDTGASPSCTTTPPSASSTCDSGNLAGCNEYEPSPNDTTLNSEGGQQPCTTAGGNWYDGDLRHNGFECNASADGAWTYETESLMEVSYLFDESSGDLLDKTSNSLDGTVTGTTRSQTCNALGTNTGYDFNGTTDIVNVGDSNNLDFADGETAFFLFSASAQTNTADFGHILAKRSGNNANYGIYKDAGSYRLGVYMNNGLGFDVWRTSDAVFESGVCHDYAVKYTSGTPSSMRVYVDGVSVAGSWVQTDGDYTWAANTADLTIGALGSAGSTSEEFDGIISNAAIYRGSISTGTGSELDKEQFYTVVGPDGWSPGDPTGGSIEKTFKGCSFPSMSWSN